jgi:hypothetical protein
MKCSSDDPFFAIILLSLMLFPAGAMLYHVLNTRGLESFRDTKHWAGKAGFIWNSMRATYGIGYTREGKRLWWRSAKFLILAYLLFFFSIFLVVYLLSHGFIKGHCI